MNPPAKANTVLNRVIDGISEIFLPIVSLLSAAGILKGLVALLVMTSAIADQSQTHLVLDAMADSLFYFLPIFLALTAAKKFGASPYLAAVIACILLYPSLTAAMQSVEQLSFFGLPMLSVPYRSSIIPIILAVWLLSYTEKWFNRIFPDIIKGFVTPLLSILTVSTATLLLFGPVGAVFGDGMALGYEFLYDISAVLAGTIFGALIQPSLIFGLHWGILLIGLNNIGTLGHDTVLALIGPAVFAQAGAAFAVMLKSKDKTFQAICASAIVSALFGITEPAMYGVNLPRKKPLIGVCLGGGLGGAVAGFSGANTTTFAFPSLVSMPVFLGEGFAVFLLSCLIGFLVAMLFTLAVKFDV